MNIVRSELIRQTIEKLKKYGFTINEIAREKDDSEIEEYYTITFSDKDNNWITYFFWPNRKIENNKICFSPKVIVDDIYYDKYYIPELSINYNVMVLLCYFFTLFYSIDDINDLKEIKKGII